MNAAPGRPADTDAEWRFPAGAGTVSALQCGRASVARRASLGSTVHPQSVALFHRRSGAGAGRRKLDTVRGAVPVLGGFAWRSRGPCRARTSVLEGKPLHRIEHDAHCTTVVFIVVE